MDDFIFTEKPQDFRPSGEAVGCYCEYDDTILFIKRHVSRPQGNTWGIPGGKIESGETPRQAVVREVREEVDLDIDDHNLEEIGKLFVRLPHIDYVFHTYRRCFREKLTVTLSDEHVEALWLTTHEALNLPQIKGGKESLHYYVKHIKAACIKPKEFYFLRHGQTDHALGLLTDVYDVPLNATGKQQASDIAQIISRLPIKTICVSPLQRAKETKEIVTKDLKVNTCEIHELSECSGEVWKQMTKHGRRAYCESIETTKTFMMQVRQGINQALNNPGPILIVAHGGVHWAMCCMMGVDHEWAIDNCVPVHFSWCDAKGWKAKILF